MQLYRLRKEHEVAVRATAKCREDLAKCQDELQEANEMVRHCDVSILNEENEKEHARSERDKASLNLERPKRHCVIMKRHWQLLSERGTPLRSTWLESRH